jgi:RNA polymerase sigma-70 factor (ECF subfamily)
LYALRAVRNSAIDLIKARSRRREVSLPDGWDAASAESIPVDAEVMQSLVKLLDALDPRSREVIELHLHAALTFQEISLVLEEPLSTVASRYRRALEKVGKEMKVRYE